MLYPEPIFRRMGDRSLLVELGDRIDPLINRKVQELFQNLDQHRLGGVIDLVPGYRSLLVIYDPLKLENPELKDWIVTVRKATGKSRSAEPKTLRVPVYYGGEHGPDLEWVARYHNLRPEEVVRIHTSRSYRVYMIGFTPGHPYLGELPDTLMTPRKQTPRTRVPRGSVGIAQKQSVIYPVESPGGFQIIGQTPLSLFDPAKQPPALLKMGDRVKFFSVT